MPARTAVVRIAARGGARVVRLAQRRTRSADDACRSRASAMSAGRSGADGRNRGAGVLFAGAVQTLGLARAAAKKAERPAVQLDMRHVVRRLVDGMHRRKPTLRAPEVSLDGEGVRSGAVRADPRDETKLQA